MMGDEHQILLDDPNKNSNLASAQDELHGFHAWLKWMCVDQSSAWTTGFSWFVFLALTVVVPALSHLVPPCGDCESLHSRPYDAVAQLSLSSIAAISFIYLSTFARKYGLRRFLFFDKLRDESETVRKGYTEQLNRSLKLLFIFVLPCFAAESAYKIWWYSSGGARIPLLGSVVVSNTVACILELCSWFYRTAVFLLVCVLFRLICHLQILRLQEFALVFQANSDVEPVLKEHFKIKRHLRIISHRYRFFILWALIFITTSQCASLLLTTRDDADVSINHCGELAVHALIIHSTMHSKSKVCSVSLVAGLLILLRSAAKITHKAQALTCLAAKWDICAMVDSFDTTETGNPVAREQISTSDSFGSFDDVGIEEDELDNTKFIPTIAHDAISVQKRQALVTYFENNTAGITLYGFTLDRTCLDTIFGIELTLVLWLLGKTVGS